MYDIDCGSPLISEEDYPHTAFLTAGGFFDFTACDVETTGLSAKICVCLQTEKTE